MTNPEPTALLCVVNFPSNTGFAWNYIEGLYADVADALKPEGITTLVAYPVIAEFPRPLQGSCAEPLLLDARMNSWKSIRTMLREIKRRNIKIVYFTDTGWWHWAHPLLRAAGVRRIVAHDHTSGERTRPGGLKRVAKWIKARMPGMTADVIICVSDYVARRQREVGIMPPSRVVRLFNGLVVPQLTTPNLNTPIDGIPSDRSVIICACRASTVKGVDHLFRAFDLVIADLSSAEPRPVLVYVGDGPQFQELKKLRESLACRDDIVLTGYRNDVPQIIARAVIAVVPSVWHEACPLGVLEPMSYAKPVVASQVGGVPDQIDSPEVGVLVPPANPEALANAISRLLRDPELRASIGAAARKRIAGHFERDTQIATLVALVSGSQR